MGQWIIIEGVPVEFIPAQGLAKESVENAVEVEFAGIQTKVIIPEYLIALLLTAGRQKDIIKVNMLLEQAEVNKGRLNEIVNRYKLNDKFKRFTKGLS